MPEFLVACWDYKHIFVEIINNKVVQVFVVVDKNEEVCLNTPFFSFVYGNDIKSLTVWRLVKKRISKH